MIKHLPALAIACLAAGTAPAMAQSLGTVELSGGFLNVNGTMNGATAQLAAPFGRHWSLVGEVDLSRGPDRDDDSYVYRDLGGLGGIRWTMPGRKVAPFWQALAGGLNSRASGEICGLFGGGCRTYRYTVNYFAVQPGAGVTFTVSPRVGIRAQADLQFAIPDQRRWEGVAVFPRVAVSTVVGLGALR